MANGLTTLLVGGTSQLLWQAGGVVSAPASPNYTPVAILLDENQNPLLPAAAAMADAATNPTTAAIDSRLSGYNGTTWDRLKAVGGVLSTISAKGSKSVVPSVSVGTSAILLLAANTSRKAAYLTNSGTASVWLGKDATVVVGSGIVLNPGDRLIDGDSTDAWYGIAVSGTNSVAVMEIA